MKAHVPGRALLLPATAVMMALAVYLAYVATEPGPVPRSKPQPEAKPSSPVAHANPMPALEARRFDAGVPVQEDGEGNPRQMAASEAAKDLDRLRKAFNKLHDADPAVRATAAERLAAYPSASSEAELIRTMAGDSEASVRRAAAQSLAAFEHPSPEAWHALLAAIRDPSEDVRSVTVEVLHSLLAAREPRDPDAIWVRREIHALQVSPQIPEATRESLQTALVGEDAH